MRSLKYFFILFLAKTSTIVCANETNLKVLRFGFFPNVTHAHALIAQNFARTEKGWYERYVPDNIRIEWYRFNAGPSAMEGILTGSLDVTYVGPSPALNVYVRSKGQEIRLLSGAVKGGSALVVQPTLKIDNKEQWNGKIVATPQYGNTQDIACREWFIHQGLKIGFLKTNVKITPTANADQLLLFKQKSIDAVWTVEPWVSRLISEANGVILMEDKDSWTTILVSSRKFLETDPELAKKILQAHKDLNEWIKQNPQEAIRRIEDELQQQVSLKLPCNDAFKRLFFETNVQKESLQNWINFAQEIGFLKTSVDLKEFFNFIEINKNIAAPKM